MTQEFAKTPIIGQQGEIPSPFIPQKNQKSLHSSSFLHYHLFMRSPIDEPKAVSYTDQSKTPAFHNNSAQHKGGK